MSFTDTLPQFINQQSLVSNFDSINLQCVQKYCHCLRIELLVPNCKKNPTACRMSQ